jgi:nucleoside-diphosphate-sugar epimerase
MKGKISVFGGTGFIGSRFCELYKNEVYLEPRESNVPKYDDVLYLISTTDNYNVLTDVHIDINTNLNKLMDVLPNVKGSISYVSSWFVYGECPLPAKEECVCNPRGFYSITKKCAEDLLISFCNIYKINYRIFRLANVYGLGDKGVGKKKNALQYLIDEIKANRDINLYHGGEFLRDYIHVDDVCKGIRMCMEKAPLNEIINIGSGWGWKFRTLMDHVAKKVNYTGTMKTVEPTEFHKLVQVRDFYMDTRKMNKVGYYTEIKMEDGLDQLL